MENTTLITTQMLDEQTRIMEQAAREQHAQRLNAEFLTAKAELAAASMRVKALQKQIRKNIYCNELKGKGRIA